MIALGLWKKGILHGAVMTVIAFFWLASGLSYGEELSVIKWSQVIRHLILPEYAEHSAAEFLFIDLAHDKSLITREDGLGNDVITDRAKLARLFAIIRQHPQKAKFILCDVFFKGKTPYDSLLASDVLGIPNIIFPAHLDDSGHIEHPSLKVPFALADYDATSPGFFKFRLFPHDSIASVPVYMYSALQHKAISRRSSLSHIIIDFKIRPYQLMEQQRYTMTTLSELLILPEDVIVEQFLNNRIVVMGDMENDVHETILGPTPGVLLLLNTYLNLKDNSEKIDLCWLMYLFISFTLLATAVLYKAHGQGWELMPVSIPLFCLAALILISFDSYIKFNKPVQILILTLYLSLVRFFNDLGNPDNKNLRESGKTVIDTYFNFK